MSSSSTVSMKVFGRLHITVGDQPVKLSGRAATLLTYLALESGRLHRTTAVQLLWPDAGSKGLKNLRVELTALRRQGIELSPGRSSLLGLQALTELDELHTLRGEAHAQFAATLVQPLENFNHYGNPVLDMWAQHQRLRMARTVGGLESLPGAQSPPVAAPLAAPSDQPLVQWLANCILPEFQSFIQNKRHPQLVIYTGRPGSGRRESLALVLTRLGLMQVEVAATSTLGSMQSLLKANLIQALRDQNPQGVARSIENHEVEANDLSELIFLLMKAGPLAIVVHNAERLSNETAPLIDLLMGLARQLLVVGLTTSAGQAHLENVLGQHDQPGWLQVIQVPALTPESLLPRRESGAPNAESINSDMVFETIRQTEGFLAAIQWQSPNSPSTRERMSARLKRTLRAEMSVALGSDLTHLQRLTLLPGPFTEVTALGTLSLAGLETSKASLLLRHALQAGILEHVDSVVAVRIPQMQIRLRDDAHLLCFRSELQRTALAGSLDADERYQLKRPFCNLPTLVELSGPGATLNTSTLSPSILERHDAIHLPGGYALLSRPNGWTILRLGASDHAVPRLELHFTAPADARRWRVHLRLQHLAEGKEIGIHVLNGASDFRKIHAEPWLQSLAPGGWMLAEGTLNDHKLSLSVQESNLVLHLECLDFLE